MQFNSPSPPSDPTHVPPFWVAATSPLLWGTAFYGIWMGHRLGSIADVIVPVFVEIYHIEKENIPWVILIMNAIFTYIISSVISAVAQAATVGYNNQEPRGPRSQLKGFALLASSAHQNFVEGFPLVASSFIIAHILNVSVDLRAELACVHLVGRVLYYPFYLSNIDVPRSLAWLMSTEACILLIVTAVFPKEMAGFWVKKQT
ncbi:hypothetical protein HK098_000753 [Nowakowskiella sp. JEL0407]|nr:hypothetical protein HK098_000753 [Nowakowskiella sp. JEL0407]